MTVVKVTGDPPLCQILDISVGGVVGSRAVHRLFPQGLGAILHNPTKRLSPNKETLRQRQYKL